MNLLVKFIMDNVLKDPLAALAAIGAYLLYCAATGAVAEYALSSVEIDIVLIAGSAILTVALTTLFNRRRLLADSKRERTVPESVYNRQQVAQAARFDQVVESLRELSDAVAPVDGVSFREFIKQQYDYNRVLRSSSREIADQSDFAYFEAGPDGTMVFANKAYCQLVGSTLADLLVSRGIHTVHTDDKERVVLEVTRAVTAGTSYITTYHIDRCGRRGDRVQLHANVIKRDDGVVLGWTGYMVKI